MIIIYTFSDPEPPLKKGFSRLYQLPDMVLGVIESTGGSYTMDSYGYRLSNKIPPHDYKQPLGDFPTNDHPLYAMILKAHGKA